MSHEIDSTANNSASDGNAVHLALLDSAGFNAADSQIRQSNSMTVAQSESDRILQWRIHPGGSRGESVSSENFQSKFAVGDVVGFKSPGDDRFTFAWIVQDPSNPALRAIRSEGRIINPASMPPGTEYRRFGARMST